MGANNSTRKITLVNDEKAGVIKLSESLAHRLRGQIENDKTSDREQFESSPKSSFPPYPSQHQLTTIAPPTPPPTPPPVEQPLQTREKEQQKQQGEGGKLETPSGEAPSWSVFAKEAHLMAGRLREEKELELKLRDEEWRKKIKEREEEYTKMAQLSHAHLQNTVKETESLFMKVSCTPVCQDQQLDVMKCYQQHSSQSLRCSDEVESFARCVDLSRLQSFMKEKAS